MGKNIGMPEGLILAILLNTFIAEIFCLFRKVSFFNYANNSKKYLSEKTLRRLMVFYLFFNTE